MIGHVKDITLPCLQSLECRVQTWLDLENQLIISRNALLVQHKIRVFLKGDLAARFPTDEPVSPPTCWHTGRDISAEKFEIR